MKIVSGFLLSLVSAVAMAHAHLQKAVPADGGVVSAAPANVVLTFSERARLTACWLQKGDGPKEKIGSLSVEAARRISVPMPQLAPGTYTVSWRVIGEDSHVVPGQIHFTVSPGTPAGRQ
jgi:methionine-rich copper-binding protein CopC